MYKIFLSIAITVLIGLTIIKIIDIKPNEVFVRYRTFTLSGSTFDMDVNVIITEDIDYAVRYVQDNLDSTVTAEDFDARAVSFPINDGKSPIIWMATTEDKGVIAHEIFHTTLNIMYWAGMELNSETEEAFAYEVQFLTNSFYNQINTIK
jgi:hypothetical protein